MTGDWVTEELATAYARVFADSPGARYICTLDGTVLDVNTAFCRLLGTKRDQVVGRSLASFSLDAPLGLEAVAPFLSGAVAAYTGTRRYRRSDGSSFLAQVTLGAERDADGRAVRIFGELEDTTARHQADDEQDRQRRRLQLAVEASGIAVWQLDVPAGRVTVQETSADHAIREQTMTYGDFVRTFHPDDQPLLPNARALRAQPGLALDVELRAGGPHVPQRWAHLKGRAVSDETGRVVLVAGSLTDVTEPRAQRGELALERDRLEMALQTAGMMAWEVRLGKRAVFSALRADLVGLELDGEVTVDDLGAVPVFGERVVPTDRERVAQALAETMAADGAELDIEYRWLDDSGATRWAHTRARFERAGTGDVQRVTGTMADVSEARGHVSARLRAERILSLTLEASPDAFIGTDETGVVTAWNPAAEALFGWFRDEMVGQRLAGRICGDDETVLQQVFEASPGGPAAEGSGLRREVEVFTRDGRRFSADISAVRVEDEGQPFHQLFVRDLSERKAYESQLIRNALFDPLTGLPNRALLLDRLSGATRRLSRVPGLLAVLFIDVDRFKHINDSLGHGAGDEFLLELAARIRSVLRPADTVARFGSDEFVVLCEALDGEREAMALALRVEGVFATPFSLGGPGGREVYASAAVGIALASSVQADAETLVRDAGTAMHRAKEHGGGHAEVFDAEIHSRSIAHLETESELRRALEHNELCVYYQPVVDLTGRLEKLEALVRWPRPSGRVGLPNEFVPLAEETGLIVALGEAVLEMACGQVNQWRREYPKLAQLEVAVNLSGTQLRSHSAVDRMASIIKSTGLPTEALVLEITESVFMDERSGAAQKLAALRSLGVRLAVDDFGTGYSSLLYLRRYPLDMLKIDRSFVAGLVDNPEDATIVDAVVRLGHSFGLQTVAEGVETAEQLRLLRVLGCDLGQGHFWSRPLPPETLIARILSEHPAGPMEVGAAPPA